MTLGERLKELRKKNGLTQVDLAKLLNVTKGTVSTWETNSRKPSFETLDEMCGIFRVGMDYLIGRSNDETSRVVSSEELDALALSSIEEDLSEYALKYARLDEYGRDAVESIIRAEYNRCRAENTLNDANIYSASIRIKKNN